MKLFTFVNGLGLVVAAAAAGRPKSESICDYYTTALLKKNSLANQEALLTLVVNTAVVGNYSDVNVGIAVAGILAPGTYMGEKVNLLPYFDGSLASTNMGGKCGVSVNFLDGGGAAPLLKSKPANDTKSNQYFLLTHLYEYFATLLGCSKFGTKKMKYAGDPSMGSVHKFMDLDPAQVGYFIEQVGLSAASFGVTKADYTAVGEALNAAFGYRCAPKVSIPSYEPAEYQSICQDCSCPVAKKPDCGGYNPVIPPRKAGAGPCGPGMSCSA